MNIRQWYFVDLKFCGCGSPETVLSLIRDVLRLTRERSERTHSLTAANRSVVTEVWLECTDKIDGRLGGRDSELRYLTLYLLDQNGLLEHGTSVAGSWLTAKGYEALELLERHGCDPDGWPDK